MVSIRTDPSRPMSGRAARRQFAQRRFLLQGHYTRGAVVVGKLYHFGGTVLGPALIEAYNLEKVAKYPRVIVTPTARYHSMQNQGAPTDIREDFDGIGYVHILAPSRWATMELGSLGACPRIRKHRGSWKRRGSGSNPTQRIWGALQNTLG